MDAWHAVNGGGDRKSRCQNGTLNLNNWYGVEHGGDRKSNTNNSVLISQTDVANKLGISVDTLQNYKKLTEMIPELEDLVDTGTHADLFNM